MRKKVLFIFTLVILVALMAIAPTSSAVNGCTLNGVEIPGDPVEVEGTTGADVIDCRTSPYGHNIHANAGDDLAYGSNYDDFIEGGDGNDVFYGEGGNDAIDGGAKDDELHGGAGDDVIFGGVGASPASGVGCTLVLAAAGSSYLTKGGSGDDIIYGDDGDDCINAGSGEDFIYGGYGNDTLEGGNHADLLEGGPGIDHIDGGWHTDTCIGKEHNTFISCELIEDSEYCEIDCGSPPECENDDQEPPEECDGTDLAGATCQSFGFDEGTLSCTASCTFDTSGCTEGICGANKDPCTEASDCCSENCKNGTCRGN